MYKKIFTFTPLENRLNNFESKNIMSNQIILTRLLYLGGSLSMELRGCNKSELGN